MSNYLDNRFDQSQKTWASPMQFPNRQANARFPQHSSGSRQNFNRGWTGNAEVQRFGQAARAIQDFTLSYGIYRGGINDIDERLDRLHNDMAHESGGPGLGAPHTSRTHHRSILAIEHGARPMPEKAGGERLALNPGPPHGYAPEPPKEPLALNPGPRVHKMGPGTVSNPLTEGFAAKLSQARAGSARTEGEHLGQMGRMGGDVSAPSVYGKGRRAKAGMDERSKRWNTWSPVQQELPF